MSTVVYICSSNCLVVSGGVHDDKHHVESKKPSELAYRIAYQSTVNAALCICTVTVLQYERKSSKNVNVVLH